MTGLYFKAIRKALCLTQLAIAEVAGYAWSTDVSKFERGKETSESVVDTLKETLNAIYTIRIKKNPLLEVAVASNYVELTRGTTEEPEAKANLKKITLKYKLK